MKWLLSLCGISLFFTLLGMCPATVCANPPLELVGGWTGGDSYAVAVSGNRAYVGMGASLVVLDISQPASPTVLGQIKLQNTVRGVAVSGNYAYVALYYSGLQVIDISNPASPVRVGGYDTSGAALGVAVSGNYAYVADYTAGLQIIDISNPAEPNRIGGYDTSGYALGVAVSGNYAYIADYGAGLQVINISNPAEPNRVGGYDTSGSAYGVAVSGNYAYVADYSAGLQVINISNPAEPNRIAGYDTSGSAYGVTISGSYAYVADGSAGLQVISISNPTEPNRVGGFDTSGYAYGIALLGNYAFVADVSAGFQVIDISNSASPVRAGGWDFDTIEAYGVMVAGNYAYIADGYVGLQVIGISNPASPVPKGICDTNGAALGVAVSGGYACVADGSTGLQVIDVANPLLPVCLGGYDTDSSAQSVTVSGNYAYVADYSTGLQVIDMSVPASPVRVGGCELIYGAVDVVLRGKYAYVADVYSGLVVIDISNPASPVLVGSYDTGDSAYGVAVSGSYACVANSYAGLKIIDISNPASPTPVGAYDTTGQAQDVAMAGTYAYVADGYSGLQVIDISNPAEPNRVDGNDTAGQAYDVAISGDYVYVADYTGGLAVFRSEYFGVESPLFSLDGGIYNSEQNITVTCPTPEAVIHYTTNGLDPNESDPIMESGSSVLIDRSLTLKARAWKTGLEPSMITAAVYQLVVAAPVFDPNGGAFDSNQVVTVTCATPGATIHYTTNDLDPNESDPIIASGSTIPVDINLPTPLKARAYKTNFADSGVKRALYRGQSPITFYVSTSGNDANSGLTWQTARRTIQSGIDAALDGPGDTVLIATGTYTGVGNRDIDFNGKAITVTGTDPQDPCTVVATIINCQYNGRGFYFHSGEEANSILAGLTIQSGRPPSYSYEGGGGILCLNASPTISKCLIRYNYGDSGNSPDSYGGGISCYAFSSPIICDCIITGNGVTGRMSAGGGGIAARYESHPVITNCSITDNSADGMPDPMQWNQASASGGGVFSEGSIEIYDSIITGNRAQGAGIMSGPGGSPVTSGGGYGGGICAYAYEGRTVTIANCVIVLNKAIGGYSSGEMMPPEPPPIPWSSAGPSIGGGIACGHEDPNNIIIRNCTVVANYAANSCGPECYPGNGGGISGPSKVANCIVRLNTASTQIEQADVTYSNVEGGYTGTGNINADPLFVEDPNIGMDPWGTEDDIEGDVHLLNGSPCIDAGDNNAVPEGITTDLDGNWRFRDDPNKIDTGNGSPPIVDMGAFERQWCPTNDLNGDCWIDFADFALFAPAWLNTPCVDPDWCGGLDFDQSGAIDWADLRLLIDEWLK